MITSLVDRTGQDGDYPVVLHFFVLCLIVLCPVVLCISSLNPPKKPISVILQLNSPTLTSPTNTSLGEYADTKTTLIKGATLQILNMH